MTAVAVDMSESSGKATAPLPAGVLFWRVSAVFQGRRETSATWEVWVGARAAMVSTSFGTTLDVDGDGYADVIVGAHGATDAAGNPAAGRVYLYRGGQGGLSATPHILYGRDGASACFGVAVASAGDVNGDGYADVIVGAGSADNVKCDGDPERAYLYFGGPNGLAACPQVLDGRDGANAHFGNAVAGAGDVDGDGYADVVVAADNANNSGGHAKAGRVYLYRGGPSGLAASPQLLEGGDGANALFGNAVAGAGDVDGDGYADVIVAADNAGKAGRVYLYRGGPNGLDAVLPPLDGGDSGDSPGAQFGNAVASAGDVDGDGYADVIVGANQATIDSNQGAGRAHLFRGGPKGLVSALQPFNGGDGAGAFFGGAVASAGDFNGDGYADVIISAINANAGAGRAHLYLGSANGLDVSRSPSLTSGDSFGTSVAGAGDVDGDGYADVIVGAGGAHDSAGQATGGRAYLFRGNSSMTIGMPTILAGSGGVLEKFGDVVASVGDGRADVIAGVHHANAAKLPRSRTSRSMSRPFHTDGGSPYPIASKELTRSIGRRSR